MSGQPRVSVVMSVYNGLPFLREAVQSIQAQSFSGWEFIITDDASRDGSWELLTSLAARDRRIHLLRNATNLGVARARNRALARAKGEFIACQDADDLSLPERLARQVEFLDKNPRVGLLGTEPTFVDAVGDSLGEPVERIGSEDDSLQSQLLDFNCFCAGSVMFRRSVLDLTGGYDPELAPAEDYDLWLRMAEKTRLAILPEGLYSYRQHEQSASRTRRFIQMKNKAVGLERALERRYAGHPPAGLSRLLARDYLRAAYIGFLQGEVEQAGEALRLAETRSPGLLRHPQPVEEVIGRYALRQQLFEPQSHLQDLFARLLPPTRPMRRARARLLSKVHMRQVFEGAQAGRPEEIDSHWWPGVSLDPGWLLNRGVWMIGARRLVQRSRAAINRTLPIRLLHHGRAALGSGPSLGPGGTGPGAPGS